MFGKWFECLGLNLGGLLKPLCPPSHLSYKACLGKEEEGII